MNAYQLDWHEVLDVVRGGGRIVACDGYIIHAPGRVIDERTLFGAWGVDVAKAVARGLEVPEKVANDYLARVAARKEGDLAVHTRPPVLVSPNGKPFTWSFSSIGDFDNCPCQYAAKRFYETVKDSETEATIWGTRVHEALEAYVKDGTPLPEDMKHWEKYVAGFVAMRAKGWEVHTELQFAIDHCMHEVGWYDPTVWGRGVIDVLAVRGDTAVIADYKTGKQKDGQFQLDIFCALTHIRFPQVTRFQPRYIWLKTGEVTGEDRTDRDIPRIWQQIIARTSRMEEAWRTQNFVPRESGLCRGWCPVTECRYWKEKRR